MPFHPAPSPAPSRTPAAGAGYWHGTSGSPGGRRATLFAVALLFFAVAVLITVLLTARSGSAAVPHVHLVPPVYVQHAG